MGPLRFVHLLSLAAAIALGCNIWQAPTISIEPRHSDSTGGDAGEPEADGGPSSTSGPAFDPTPMLAMVASGAYRGGGFAHVDRAPYASSAASGSMIDEWVSTDGAAAYAAIKPDASGSHATMPVGALVVRAVLDASGEVTKLTLMMKGPPGYNPDLGDWWFGETDPAGAPLADDAGALTGRLSQCYSCHVPRADDDFLFGVPSADAVTPPK